MAAVPWRRALPCHPAGPTARVPGHGVNTPRCQDPQRGQWGSSGRLRPGPEDVDVRPVLLLTGFADGAQEHCLGCIDARRQPGRHRELVGLGRGGARSCALPAFVAAEAARCGRACAPSAAQVSGRRDAQVIPLLGAGSAAHPCPSRRWMDPQPHEASRPAARPSDGPAPVFPARVEAALREVLTFGAEAVRTYVGRAGSRPRRRRRSAPWKGRWRGPRLDAATRSASWAEIVRSPHPREGAPNAGAGVLKACTRPWRQVTCAPAFCGIWPPTVLRPHSAGEARGLVRGEQVPDGL